MSNLMVLVCVVPEERQNIVDGLLIDGRDEFKELIMLFGQ